ncbi:MAG: hypothetical protein M3Y83_13260 [Actinomycetota bacterium]|nr:hypothetical protein [Actinomycetota bacterium]
MAVREIGTSPIVFGRATELYESMAAEFRRHGVIGDQSAESRAGTSIIVVLDGGLIVSVVGDGALSEVRRQDRASETQIRGAVTDTAIATGAQRLLVVCDLRHTPDEKHARAIDWLRELAHRIGYECSMNGLHDLATSIAAVRSDAEALRTAQAVVNWHKGIRRSGGWFAKRYAGADA